MNKLLWRGIKLAAIIFAMYFGVVQLLYVTSQSKAPFKQDKVPVPIDKMAPVIHDKQPSTSRSFEPTNIVAKPLNAAVIEPSRKYVNTLLMKPQQQFDFHHNVRSAIWPDSGQPGDDRIISQMSYDLLKGTSSLRPKQILVYSGVRDGIKSGDASFISQKCPVTNCEITYERSASRTADVILWQDHVSLPSVHRPPGQIWIVFLLESPYHTPNLGHLNNLVNWTATYRRDSTIVAPYERFTLFNSSVEQLPLAKNYAEGKSKKVAWFVSNCGARNNRLGYAKELGKYIEVDIYGACGTKQCPRSSSHCFDLLSSTYKFYLAFENSNCRNYITEKFFVNGLKNDVLPIVMGAHPDDYRDAAPKKSYIHVDDFESPQKLAEYLIELDEDDDKYNEYFRWKGTGDNINTYFWCRLCAMANAADITPPPPAYSNLNDWWRGSGVCKSLGSEMWPRW